MRKVTLWGSVCDFSKATPSFSKGCIICYWLNRGACEPYVHFQHKSGYSWKINNYLYNIFAVDNLPVELPDDFFFNLLAMKVFCLIGDYGFYNKNSRIRLSFQKEAGACLMRMQDILNDHGLRWKTLWDYNIIHINRSTAGRYKRLARK